MKETFLTPSNSTKETFDNLIVPKSRLIDYMLSFGVDLFFKSILGHFREYDLKNGGILKSSIEPALERPQAERAVMALQ